MTALVEAEGVQRYFSNASWFQRTFLFSSKFIKAVDGVTLSIAAGEIVGLVGESGCGKTTLGWLLAGLEQPTGGEIRFKGRSLRKMGPDARRKVQLLFQYPKESLNPRQSIRTILRYPLYKTGYTSNEVIDVRIHELLDTVGLPTHYADRYSFQLSGGELQRVALARILALEPEFIVCDEPTSAVDTNVKAQILQLLFNISRDKQISLLFISHDLSAVRFIADKICVMYLGRIVEQATPQQLYDHPRHPYTMALLEAIAEIDPSKKRTISLEGQPPSPANPPPGCRFHPRCRHGEKVGPKCSESEPALKPLSADHLVRCFLYPEVNDEIDQPLINAGAY